MAAERDLQDVGRECLMAGVQAAKRGDDPARVVHALDSTLHYGCTREDLRAKVARDCEWEAVTSLSATYASGIVSIVFQATDAGEPGIGVETYNHRTGESLVLFQPGKKTFFSSWKQTGPFRNLGPAEKLPRQLRGETVRYELGGIELEERRRLLRELGGLGIPHLTGMTTHGYGAVIQADHAPRVMSITGWPAA